MIYAKQVMEPAVRTPRDTWFTARDSLWEVWRAEKMEIFAVIRDEHRNRWTVSRILPSFDRFHRAQRKRQRWREGKPKMSTPGQEWRARGNERTKFDWERSLETRVDGARHDEARTEMRENEAEPLCSRIEYSCNLVDSLPPLPAGISTSRCIDSRQCKWTDTGPRFGPFQNAAIGCRKWSFVCQTRSGYQIDWFFEWSYRWRWMSLSDRCRLSNAR